MKIDDSEHFRFFGEQNDGYPLKERKILAPEGCNEIFFVEKSKNDRVAYISCVTLY